MVLIETIKETKHYKVVKHNSVFIKNPIYFLYLYTKTDYTEVKKIIQQKWLSISKIDFTNINYILFIYKKGDNTKRIKYYNNNWQIGHLKVIELEYKYEKKVSI